MKLIVGLGNPGPEYDRTRHNMGFKVIDKLSAKYSIEVNHSKFKGMYGTGLINGEKIILFKPYTYMNLSGEAVEQIAAFYKVNLEDLIVIYDDIDIAPGLIRIRKSGSAGSHNGMKSVTQMMGSTAFPRVRVGTGKPDNTDHLIEYVIGAIDEDEKPLLEEGIQKAADAVSMIIEENIDLAMNRFNIRPEKEDGKKEE